MKTFISIKNISALLAGPLFLASCGSSQYVGYESDGIYSSVNQPTYAATEEVTDDQESNNGSYYQQLFQREVEQLDAAKEQTIFTDVESYSSGNYDEAYQEEGYASGYAPWGHEVDGIDINIYDNRPYYGYYGYYGYGNPYFYDPFYPPYYGWSSGGWR